VATHKLKCRKGSVGKVYITCPICRREQELPLTDEWYHVELDGKVFPDFVCMEPLRRCRYAESIWIVNW